MKYIVVIPSLCLFACIACTGPQNKVPVLTEQWVLEGFDSPESVAADATGKFLYVSNVNGGGEDKDGNGYIATIALDGTPIAKSWADGLDGPKGLALEGDVLYVSDIDRLVIIDTVTGDIIDRVRAEGATFLNDVVIWPEHGVLVSDSGTARIYLYKDGEMSVWAEDEKFGGINGLMVWQGALLVVTMDAGELLSVDLKTKEISTLAGGMKNADMMTPLDEGGYIVSSWPGVLRYVAEDGSTQVLLNTEEIEVFMNDFVRIGNMLYVPNWQPGTVRAYSISY